MRSACLRLRAKGVWGSGRTAFSVERCILAMVVPSRHLAWVPHFLFPTSKACYVKTVRFGWNFPLQGSRAWRGFSQSPNTSECGSMVFRVVISHPLGANREGKKRVNGKASRIQGSRIGSALVCVRRNAQHHELQLPESTRFVLNTVLMIAVSTRGPTGANPPLLSAQNMCVCVCVCVCVFIRLHITAQPGPVILVILCHLHRSSQGGVCVCVCIYQIARNRAIRPCHPRHFMPLALILPRGDQ